MICSNRIFNGLIAVFQLLTYARGRSKNQVGMVVGMIADGVSSLLDGADDIGPLPHILSDQKKCGPGIVLCKQVEQMKGVRIVGPVIIGKCHLPGVSAISNSAPIKL